MKNVISVDLEDYYCDLPFSTWKNFKPRVVKNTSILLELFKKYHVNATFFTVGRIAEIHPELIEDIVSQGHEIASHSYAHIDLRKHNIDEFEGDLVKSIKILEKISGEKVNGFRAPFFSINKKNLQVFKILRKYLKYDSSIFPVKTPLYGIPDAQRKCYQVSEENPLEEETNGKFFELPMSTLRLPIIGNIPIAGGFHLRFLPLSLIKYGIKKTNTGRDSAMCYIHPKDIDPQMPKIDKYGWHYYWNLKNGLKKFESLLKNFHFGSVREVIFENQNVS